MCDLKAKAVKCYRCLQSSNLAVGGRGGGDVGERYIAITLPGMDMV